MTEVTGGLSYWALFSAQVTCVFALSSCRSGVTGCPGIYPALVYTCMGDVTMAEGLTPSLYSCLQDTQVGSPDVRQ